MNATRRRLQLLVFYRILSREELLERWGKELYDVAQLWLRREIASGVDPAFVNNLQRLMAKLRQAGAVGQRGALRKAADAILRRSAEKWVMRYFRVFEPKTYAAYAQYQARQALPEGSLRDASSEGEPQISFGASDNS